MKHARADLKSPATPPQNADRRQLLLTVLTAGIGVALARKARAESRPAVSQEGASRGYQETAHVRDYYASTRLRRV